MNYQDQAIILQILVPLISALAVITINRNKCSWYLSCASTLFAIFNLIYILGNCIGLSYNIGGWNNMVGIELNASKNNIFILLSTSIIFINILIYSYKLLSRKTTNINMIYTCLLMLYTSLSGILLTNDLFNLYVFIEVMSISAYTLIAIDARSLRNALEYLIIGTIGATFYLIGVGFLYLLTGTLNIVHINNKLQTVTSYHTLNISIYFMIIGLLIKSAMFPFHGWLLKAYTVTSSLGNIIISFFSGTITKIMIFILINTVFNLYGEYIKSDFSLYYTLVVISILGIIIPSLAAYSEKSNPKKIINYSSVSDTAYILLISLTIEEYMKIICLLIIFGGITKSTLFICFDIIQKRIGNIDFQSLMHNNHKIPKLVKYIICILCFDLISLPMTTGFIYKYYLLSSLVINNMYIILAFISMTSILSIIYIWRIIESIYYPNGYENQNTEYGSNILVYEKLPLLTSSSIILFFGMNIKIFFKYFY